MKLSNKDYADLVLEQGVDIRNRTVQLFGDVDAAMASKCVGGLALLTGDDPITIYLNSDGGSVEDGLVIYDAIRRADQHINIVATGQCYSMAFIILQAADTRQATSWTSFMTHQMTFAPGGNPETVINWARWGKDLEERFNRLLASKTRKTAAWWKNKQRADAVFNVTQALELGVIDEVV